MKSDNYNIDNEDKFINDFMLDFETDQPTKDFTKNTMNEVMQQWVANPIVTESKISWKTKLWTILGAASAFVLVYFIDFKGLNNGKSFGEIFQFQATQHSISKTLHSFTTEFTNVPTLVYLVILGIGLIVLLDRVISRLNHQKLIL